MVPGNHHQSRRLVSIPGGTVPAKLDVQFKLITVQWDNIKECAASTAVPKLRLHIKYYLHNSGTSDFKPPAGFIGTAECDNKPAILGFLDLQGFPALAADQAGKPKFAACVVDDVISPSSEGDCAAAGSEMKISAGRFYGSTKSVTVKYTLDATALNAMLESDSSATITLKVNQYLSPGGAGKTATLSIGSLVSIVTDQSAAPVLLYNNP